MQTQHPAVILVVDNDPLTLTGVAASLHLMGHECHCAQTTDAALKAAANLALDLIICNVRLDGEDGIESCREIRRIPGREDVPVLFTSEHQIPDIIRRTHDGGGTYYLRKPFDPEVLLDLVDKALWMPHLVHTRVQQAAAGVPAPAMKTIATAARRIAARELANSDREALPQ